MSFSCSVPATKPEDLSERLAGLEPSPAIVNPAGQAAFEKAKAAFEALAGDVASGDYNISGSISGHFAQEGYSQTNSIALSLGETTVQTPEEQAAQADGS